MFCRQRASDNGLFQHIVSAFKCIRKTNYSLVKLKKNFHYTYYEIFIDRKNATSNLKKQTNEDA